MYRPAHSNQKSTRPQPGWSSPRRQTFPSRSSARVNRSRQQPWVIWCRHIFALSRARDDDRLSLPSDGRFATAAEAHELCRQSPEPAACPVCRIAAAPWHRLTTALMRKCYLIIPCGLCTRAASFSRQNQSSTMRIDASREIAPLKTAVRPPQTARRGKKWPQSRQRGSRPR